MGNCLKRKQLAAKDLSEEESKNDQKQKQGVEIPPPAKPLKSWEIRRLQQKNRDDFECKNRENERIIKQPGSLNGLQYKIESCVNCEIYVLDHSTTIFIDECVNCKIFIGPCKASVFVRDCKECVMTIACQQYRSRDCENIKTFLYCQSQPVIESCVNMQFGCFSFAYPQLAQQFKDCGLPPWTNNWSDIYDFTKNQNGSLNYSYLPENQEQIMPYACDVLSTLCAREYCEDKENYVVPITKGLRIDSASIAQCTIIMLYPTVVAEMIDSLVSKFNSKQDISIVRTLLCKLDSDSRIDSIFTLEQKQAFLAQHNLSSQVLFIQLITNNLQSLKSIFNTPDPYFAWNKNYTQLPKLSKIIFENWDDERNPN